MSCHGERDETGWRSGKEVACPLPKRDQGTMGGHQGGSIFEGRGRGQKHTSCSLPFFGDSLRLRWTICTFLFKHGDFETAREKGSRGADVLSNFKLKKKWRAPSLQPAGQCGQWPATSPQSAISKTRVAVHASSILLSTAPDSLRLRAEDSGTQDSKQRRGREM